MSDQIVRIALPPPVAFRRVRELVNDIAQHCPLIQSIETVNVGIISEHRTIYERIWRIDVPYLSVGAMMPQMIRDSMMTFDDRAEWREDTLRCVFECRSRSQAIVVGGIVTFTESDDGQTDMHSQVDVQTNASHSIVTMPMVGTMVGVITRCVDAIVAQVIGAVINMVAGNMQSG